MMHNESVAIPNVESQFLSSLQSGNIENIRTLISNGMNPNTKINGKGLLTVVAEDVNLNNRKAIIKMLLSLGVKDENDTAYNIFKEQRNEFNRNASTSDFGASLLYTVNIGGDWRGRLYSLAQESSEILDLIKFDSCLTTKETLHCLYRSFGLLDCVFVDGFGSRVGGWKEDCASLLCLHTLFGCSSPVVGTTLGVSALPFTLFADGCRIAKNKYNNRVIDSALPEPVRQTM